MDTTTKIIYDLIVSHPDILKKIQSFWELPIRDAEGFEVMPNRSERIEDLKDVFYIQADSISFNNPFMAAVFDALTEDIDWSQLEILLYEGAEDED